jgi:hypothetical protein
VNKIISDLLTGKDNPTYELVEILGGGTIGFTWNGAG